MQNERTQRFRKFCEYVRFIKRCAFFLTIDNQRGNVLFVHYWKQQVPVLWLKGNLRDLRYQLDHLLKYDRMSILVKLNVP